MTGGARVERGSVSTGVIIVTCIVVLLLLALGSYYYYKKIHSYDESETVAVVAASAEPQVWHVLGDGGGAEDINILFLGDGFVTEPQLDAYRSVVYQLAAGLVSRPPFCHHASHMEFFRIDVRDDKDTYSDSSCGSGCVALLPLDAGDPLVPPPGATRIGSGTDTVDLDLGATRCWTSGVSGASASCYVFWTDSPGQEAAYHLAQRLPDESDVEIVVVVVNVQEDAGAGLYNANLDVDRLVFVGVVLEPTDSGLETQVSEATHLTFAHEMGHALGLLDEYQVNSRPPRPPDSNRNVWVTATTTTSAGSLAASGLSSATAEPPWEAALGDCDAASMVPCCGGPSGTVTCKVCSGISSASCHKVPAICQDALHFCYGPYTELCVLQASCAIEGFEPKQLCAPEDCEGPVGAWEGAVYSRTDYFRAKRYCRMKELESQHGFCEACALYLSNRIFTYTGAPTYTESIEKACPTPTEQEAAGLGVP